MKVLLPEPEAPMPARNSPGRMRKETPRSACTSTLPMRYVLRRERTSTTGRGAPPASDWPTAPLSRAGRAGFPDDQLVAVLQVPRHLAALAVGDAGAHVDGHELPLGDLPDPPSPAVDLPLLLSRSGWSGARRGGERSG